MRYSLLPLLSFSIGCTRLPEAPETLEELTNYLFEHFDDEEPESLQAGVLNLEAWLEGNMEQANAGYKVQDLSEVAVSGLDGNNLTLDGQVGVAVSYDLWHNAEDVTKTLASTDARVLYPDNYESFERSFVDDLDCFLDQDCEFIRWEATSSSKYPLNIKVETSALTDYRWVQLDDGYAAISRNWMIAPATVNVDWFKLKQQYALSVLINRSGITRKLDAGWVILSLGAIPLPENTAINMAADSFLESGEQLEAYLDENNR